MAAEPERGPRIGFTLPSAEKSAQCLAARERGREAAKAGDWRTAVKQFRRATVAFPESHSDWYDLACSLSRTADTEGALLALDRAVSLAWVDAPRVSSDADLAPLHGLPAYESLIGRLIDQAGKTSPPPPDDQLARTVEEVDELSARVTEQLTEARELLAYPQLDSASTVFARWRAASFDRLAGLATDPAERERLTWESFSSFLNERNMPMWEGVTGDILERASAAAPPNSPHAIDAAYAAAIARVRLATVRSASGSLTPGTKHAFRDELLAIAATSPDQAALEPVLVTSCGVFADDLPVATGLYRRLLRIAARPADARQAAQHDAPGVVLVTEGLPPFQGVTTTGAIVSNDTLKSRLTLVDFWGTWCGPCVQELPSVAALHGKYGARGLAVLGIAAEAGDPPDPKAFATWCTDHQVAWPQILEAVQAETAISATLGVSIIPHYLLIDENARVVATGGRLEMLMPEIERRLGNGVAGE